MRAAQAPIDQLDDAACRALGINRTDGRCLDIIDREGPVPAGRLAEASGLTTAAVTAVIDRLEKAGYAAPRSATPTTAAACSSSSRRSPASAPSVIWGPFADVPRRARALHGRGARRCCATSHRMGREYNEQRAAEVRELRFD